MAASSNAVAASPRPPDGLAALFLANDFRGRHASAFVVVTEDGGDWDARFFEDAPSGRAEHAKHWKRTAVLFARRGHAAAARAFAPAVAEAAHDAALDRGSWRALACAQKKGLTRRQRQ